MIVAQAGAACRGMELARQVGQFRSGEARR
jgi:hypothetical protein